MKKYRFFAVLLAFLLALSLTASPAMALEPEVGPHAGAALVVDGDNDEVLYAYHAYERMYPASVTKIMTSLVVLEAIDNGELTLDTQVVASDVAIQVPYGSSTADPPIQAGEILTVEQLLYCDLLPSACEACNVLSEAVTGLVGEAATIAFAERMNAKAAELGMKDTHFTNPHGLHDPNHYTTAYDIYLMAKAAMQYDIFRTIVSTGTYILPATNMTGQRTLHTTNSLLDNWYSNSYLYSKAIGIKTGNTDEAGRCLASAAVDEQGRTFYCVILGSEYANDENGNYVRWSFSETIRLLEWAFQNFKRVTLLNQDTPDVIREVKVTLAEEVEHVLAQPVGSIEATMPSDYDPSKAELIFDLPKEPLEAPISAGDVLGTVTFKYEGVEYGTLNMVAADNVERSEFLYNLYRLELLWSQWWVKALVFGGIALFLLLILYLVFIRPRRRRRYSYSGSGSRGGRSSYRGRRR